MNGKSGEKEVERQVEALSRKVGDWSLWEIADFHFSLSFGIVEERVELPCEVSANGGNLGMLVIRRICWGLPSSRQLSGGQKDRIMYLTHLCRNTNPWSGLLFQF